MQIESVHTLFLKPSKAPHNPMIKLKLLKMVYKTLQDIVLSMTVATFLATPPSYLYNLVILYFLQFSESIY